MAKKQSEAVAPADGGEAAPAAAAIQGGISKKALIILGVVVVAIWAFTLSTHSTVLLIIVSVLTAVLAAVMIWAFRMLRKQRRVVSLLQGATHSTEARRDALARLSEGKDAGTPTNLFARAQLMAQDNPAGALKLLESTELKSYPPGMQDDVSLLKTQLYLNNGSTANARKCADSMNLDNPQRKEVRPFAAALVAEAWARTGKPKEAIALLETIVAPAKATEQSENIAIQARVARVFARFAANQRAVARTEMMSLADEDPNYLGKFVMPQFKVHPELQKLARQVLQQHPSARRQMKIQQR